MWCVHVRVRVRHGYPAFRDEALDLTCWMDGWRLSETGNRIPRGLESAFVAGMS